MQIFTKVDKFTIDKIISENKSRTEKEIFPIGSVTVPVIFGDIQINNDSFFRVEKGNLVLRGVNQKIDFRFKLYGKEDGPNVIPDMINGFNGFVNSFRERKMNVDSSIFQCIDRILYDLGYVGKMVKAAGIEKDEKGELSIFSFNYAENLITKEDCEYMEYQYASLTKNI